MSDFINVLRERGFVFTGGSILACQIAGEIERLRHDIGRHINITTEQHGEIESLRAENAALKSTIAKLFTGYQAGTATGDRHGGRIVLHYETAEQADAAFEAWADLWGAKE